MPQKSKAELNETITSVIMSTRTPLGIEEMENQIYFALHDQAIWQKDNAWFTHLYTEDGKRKLVKRNSRAKLEQAIIEHYKNLSSIPTLEECFNDWLKMKTEYREIALGTRDRYVNDFKRYLKGSGLDTKKITDVTEDDLKWLCKNNIVEKELSAKAYAGMRTILIGIFKYAKDRKLTSISISTFFKDLEISRKSFTKPKRKPQVFLDEEVQMIKEYILDHKTVGRLGVLLAFQTGMREGELAGLKFSDIEGNVMHIQRQEIKYKSGKVGEYNHDIVNYNKTEAGTRDIIITQKAIETINEIRKLNPDGEYVMMNKGKRMFTNSYNAIIYTICDELNIPRRSMHKIRKTYGTILLDSGMDESLVMNQMGHSDIATTRRYYYFSNKSFDKKVSQINAAINF